MPEIEGTGDASSGSFSSTNQQLNTGSDLLISAVGAAGAFNAFQAKIDQIVALLETTYGTSNTGDVDLGSVISSELTRLLMGEELDGQRETTDLMEAILLRVGAYLFNAEENEISLLQTKITEALPAVISQLIQGEGEDTNPLKQMKHELEILIHANYILEKVVIPNLNQAWLDLTTRMANIEKQAIDAAFQDSNRTSSSNHAPKRGD